MEDPVVPFDLVRMFVGDSPWLFYAEIAARTLIIYGYMFLLIRVLGRRSKSQLSILDVLVILALGSAVGDGNFYPEVPVLHCLLVITLIVGINKTVTVLADRFAFLRRTVEGRPRTVVRDGVILTEELAKTGIGLHDLLELMRLKGVCNLGQVDTVVLESSSDLSIYRRDAPQPGLSILPDRETSRAEALSGEGLCCSACGMPRADDRTRCAHTGCHVSEVAPLTRPAFPYP